MARRPDFRPEEVLSEDLKHLRHSLSLLSGASVEDFYRRMHKDCLVERKPNAKAVQSLVTAWKILRKWKWR